MSTEVTPVCLRCAKAKPLSEYETVKRRARICKPCRELENMADNRAGHWDYADALRKAKKLQLRRTKAYSGDFYDSLTSSTIRALMKLQENKCMLTGEPFCLPTEEEFKALTPEGTGSNFTLTAWADRFCDKYQRARIPELVRINTKGDWEPTNVMLVTRRAAEIYEKFTDYHTLRSFALKVAGSPPKTFSSEEISRVERDINIRRNARRPENRP